MISFKIWELPIRKKLYTKYIVNWQVLKNKVQSRVQTVLLPEVMGGRLSAHSETENVLSPDEYINVPKSEFYI